MPKLHKSLEVFLRQPIPVEVSRSDAEKALELIGYRLSTYKSSHYTWLGPGKDRITYSLKGGRSIERGAIRDIARAIRKAGYGE